jgi:hypothetical protein
MWAALTWDTLANWPARTRGEAFLHESFHIVQMRLGLVVSTFANRPIPQVFDSTEFRRWLLRLDSNQQLSGYCRELREIE